MVTELGQRAGFLLDYVAALMPQGMGGMLRGGIVAGQTGKFQPRIDLNYRFQKGVSARNMAGYLRWSMEGLVSVLKCIKIILPARPTLPQNCIALN